MMIREMDHSINIYEDVISQELCDELIALHTTEKRNVGKEIIDPTDNSNVECYYLDLNDYPEKEEKVSQVVDGIIDRVLKDNEWFPEDLTYGSYALRKHYGKTLLHVDGLHDEDSKFGHRILSVIIALSDDYDGGVFNFPKQNYQVKLKKREAITFPPNHFYPHEVSTANNGDRYSINLWILEEFED